MKAHAFVLGLFTAFTALTGCGPGGTNATDTSGTKGLGVVDRLKAFETEKGDLAQEAKDDQGVTTVPVTLDDATPPSVITDLEPPKDGTPEPLQGVFWMRGNPLPDYLLSFANFHWTEVNGTPYGFLETFAPGSFAWKPRAVAQGAPAGDYGYVPEICRVPKDDPALAEVAHLAASHDSKRYRQSIADDLAAGPQETVSDDEANAFIDGVWNGGQDPKMDGAPSVQELASKHYFYETKFNTGFTEATVTIFRLFSGPLGPVALEIPEEVATFSLAPHPTDPDVYLRKSYFKGSTKVPNYYWLTRIVDEQGRPTPHYKEFLRCVQQRSAGQILKVVAPANDSSTH